MKTNLIIAEGLPGSGKSTTAAMIAQELEKKGVKTVCIDLRASKGKEPFYEKLGFEAMTAEASDCGMEKMIEK